MKKHNFIMIPSFFILGATMMKFFYSKKIRNENIPYPIHFEVGFQLFNRWIQMKNKGKDIRKYFEDNQITNVAIYGMGALGERLYEDLKLCNLDVKYGIDKKAESILVPDLKIISPEGKFEHVDIIIVTPIQCFEEIKEVLEEKTDAVIISLEDIIDYCLD